MKKMNLANKITLIRVFILPLIIIIPLLAKINPADNFLGKDIIIKGVLESGKYNITWCNLIILFIFVIGALTDAIDGHIARSRNLITDFGKFLDPLADKLLVVLVMLILMEDKRIASWALAIILAREFAVTGLRVIAAGKGDVIAASIYGKIKTVLQMTAVIFLLLNNFPFSVVYVRTGIDIPFSQIVLYLAVIMTIVSGIDYFVKNKFVFKDM